MPPFWVPRPETAQLKEEILKAVPNSSGVGGSFTSRVFIAAGEHRSGKTQLALQLAWYGLLWGGVVVCDQRAVSQQIEGMWGLPLLL